MQGTVLMLVALSGLGCHNKSADVVFTPPAFGCYGGGSYASIYAAGVAPSCFSSCYTSSYSGCYSSGCYGGGCYGGCYSSCYSGLYDGGHHGCGLFAKLFGGCGWKSHHSSCYFELRLELLQRRLRRIWLRVQLRRGLRARGLWLCLAVQLPDGV